MHLGDGARTQFAKPIALATAELQQQVDRCADRGGGTVVVPPGRHVIGTLVLRSHVHLVLAPGATIAGSTDLADYPEHVPALRSYADNYTRRSVIYAEGAVDVSVSGDGEVDGQGAAFTGNEYLERPYIMRFVGCQRVRVRDITLRNSAMWVQHYLGCEDVVIDGITVASRANINNDGIDIDSSERVRISNCDISTEDDAIVLKATAARPCRDISVTNCILQSDCNAFKIGTETVGDISDVVFSNSTIRNTGLSAIALETVDGGALERVSVTNVTFRSAAGAIFVRLGHRGRPIDAIGTADYYDAAKSPIRNPIGRLEGIRISNVIGVGADGIGASITGQPGHPIRDVELTNVTLRFAGGGRVHRGETPELPDTYPEYRMFGPLPAFGLTCRHVDGLQLAGLRLTCAVPDDRPALYLEDVTEIVGIDGDNDVAVRSDSLPALTTKGEGTNNE